MKMKDLTVVVRGMLLTLAALTASFLPPVSSAGGVPMAIDHVPSGAVYLTSLQEAIDIVKDKRWCGEWENKGKRKMWCEVLSLEPYAQGATEVHGKVNGDDGGKPYGGNVKLKMNDNTGRVVLIDRNGNTMSLATSNDGNGQVTLYYIFSENDVYPAVVSSP